MSSGTVGRAAVLALAAGLAAAGWQVHPVMALVPLVCLGVPAGLLLRAGWGGRDPYDVRHLYPGPGAGAASASRPRLGDDAGPGSLYPGPASSAQD